MELNKNSKLIPAFIKQYGSHLPWCEDDPEKLGPTIMQFTIDQEPYFSRWCQKWFENYQFVYGVHNVRWSKRYDFAIDTDFLRRPSPFTLKSQTNLARVVLEGLASFIYGNVPTWTVETAEESFQKGKRFREICQKLLDCYMERLMMDEEFYAAAITFIMYGQCAAKVDWDANAGMMLRIPAFRKLMKPMYTDYMANNPVTGGLLEVPTYATGGDGQPIQQQAWEPILDENGRQAYHEKFSGDLKVDILTPFEYRRQIGSRGMHKTSYVQQFKIMDYDQFIYEYKNTDGETKHFKGIKPMTMGSVIYNFAVKQYMRMQYLTPPVVSDTFRRTEHVLRGSLLKDKVMVVEHYDQPKKGLWDTGRKTIVANGFCTHVTKPSYFMQKKDGWHPFVEAQWLTVAPSSIATGPLNDVIVKNKELDLKDTLIATSVRRNFGSALLIKPGIGIDKNQFTGAPGQIIEAQDLDGVRWLHDSMPLSPVIQQLREADKQDVYESSGAQDALRGDRSKNVSAGYALKQLEEREQKRLTPPKRRIEKFAANIGMKMIACLKANVIQLDDDVMGFLKRSAAGSFEAQDVIAFLSQPIDFGVDIKVEPDSMAAKSIATMQANMLELAKGPANQRIQSNAKVLDGFLKYFGAETLRDSSSTHRDRAKRENEVFSDMQRLGPDTEGIRTPVVLFEDDDSIHIEEHIEDLLKNADEILSNEPNFTARLMHLEMHRIQMQEKTGEVAPGTTVTTPQQYLQAKAQPPPQVPMIAQMNQQMRMVKQQQAGQQAPQAGVDQGPKSPGTPKAPGQPGAKPVNPATPSQNTPTGASSPSQGG